MPRVRALQVSDGRLVRPLPAVKELQPLLLPRVHQGVCHRAKTASKAFQGPWIHGWVLFLVSLSPVFLPKNEATTISGKRVAYILPKETGLSTGTWVVDSAPSAGPSLRRGNVCSTCSPRASLTTAGLEIIKGKNNPNQTQNMFLKSRNDYKWQKSWILCFFFTLFLRTNTLDSQKQCNTTKKTEVQTNEKWHI